MNRPAPTKHPSHTAICRNIAFPPKPKTISCSFAGGTTPPAVRTSETRGPEGPTFSCGCWFRVILTAPNTIRFFGTSHARNVLLFPLACLAAGGFDKEAAPGRRGDEVPALVPGAEGHQVDDQPPERVDRVGPPRRPGRAPRGIR